MDEVKNTKLILNTPSQAEDEVALATTGIAVDYTKKDDGKILILLNNSGTAATCTIPKGNGLQGTTDLEITLPASKVTVITVESGKFVNVYGQNKGQLILKGAATIKARVIELP